MKENKDKIAEMYAPFEEYVTNVVKLMIFHIWDKSRHTKTSAIEQFEDVQWLSRLVTLDKRVTENESLLPEWLEIKKELVLLIDNCESSESAINLLEEKGLNLLFPFFKSRFISGYTFPEQPFHHFWYTTHNNNELLAVHFINANMPNSLFSDMKVVATYLLKTIEDAITHFPEIKIVECGTWVNNVSHFLELWPESYKNNRNNWKYSGGFGPGWWGQYLTARGNFNFKAAQVLRESGKHRNPFSTGFCNIDEELSHLKSFLNN